MSRINKNVSQKPAPKPAAAKNVSSNMPPAPKPQGTWITGDDGTPNVYVPASAQTHGQTPVQKPVNKPVNAKGTLSFGPGFQQATQGDLVAGGKLDINYDLGRFSKLLTNSHDGFPAWGVTAYVMAQPSGVIQEKQLVSFSDGQGSNHGPAQSVPASFDVPAGSTSVQVWFKNWTGADAPSAQYDSNFGRNYTFDVKQPA